MLASSRLLTRPRGRFLVHPFLYSLRHDERRVPAAAQESPEVPDINHHGEAAGSRKPSEEEGTGRWSWGSG